IHAPYRSVLSAAVVASGSPLPPVQVADLLSVEDDNRSISAIDGQPATAANAVRLDLRGEFNRRKGGGDPPIDVCFNLANRLLTCLRSACRAGFMRPIDNFSIWKATFLS